MNYTVIEEYLTELTEQFYTGHAREHAYRPALKKLMNSFEDVIAVNDPSRSEHGNPDFIFIKKSNQKIIRGYAEAKDIGISLDKTEKTNQMDRYGGYANLFLTDYLEFRFFKNGDKYKTISLGYVKDGKLYKSTENIRELFDELKAFLELPPEKISSGRRLAQIMGGKARRIRGNVEQYLKIDSDDKIELDKIYEMMKTSLVHDLSHEKFADMYAQTLVYGLFVARYGDTTPDNFTRSEARDLVPKSNPFLRHFFDHIVGPDFDTRLGYIVDELCEVFSVSNVQQIVHKHLRIADQTTDAKDPIIHFYEDFLQEYDPLERKKMGAYYTPIPVVKFIVSQVDKILKEEFGIAKGLSSDETFQREVETGQDLRHDRRKKLVTSQIRDFYRVQVLDPAVGTATFLNETIKYIHEEFEGQEGRWPAYVKDNLVNRLFGFELMMAPYTIAHLKLGMTLKETGVNALDERLNVFLTNTLEEGVPLQQDLFSFGLAQAVSDESRQAAEIKSESPIMIVMGNPPYSVSSNNKSKYIEKLVADYKKDLNERNIQPLSDDYIKFIRFAENMITKVGEGIVAMITNNSYIDGLIHRQMRKHLLQTFDKIYILDLHGSTKKKETAIDGSRDENVFDIQQGVSIILAIKTNNNRRKEELADVYFAELFGLRKTKFTALNDNDIQFKSVSVIGPDYSFAAKENPLRSEYSQFISLASLMPVNDVGISTYRDGFVIDIDEDKLIERIKDFYNSPAKDIEDKYKLKFSQGKNIEERQIEGVFDEDRVYITEFRPFDRRFIYYSADLVDRPRQKNTKHILNHNNISLVTIRRSRDESKSWNEVFVTNNLPTGSTTITSLDRNYIAPLYLYHEDGTKSPNLDPTELSILTQNLTIGYSPENILDYVYAILHSQNFIEKYGALLKNDFPRIPPPKNNKEFERLVKLGKELRELHLMNLSSSDSYSTTFPEVGTNIIEKLNYDNQRVYINNGQYFGNVPKTAWDFYIGGYQPAQKWLKDRKGRELSNIELEHYQKIIKILLETDRIMKEIDNE